MLDYKEKNFKYKTEHYDIDEDWTPYRIGIDNNDFGSICIDVLQKDKSIDTTLRLWFDRKTSIAIVNNIIECLANYPNDQKHRLNMGLDCSCKTRIDQDAS